MRKFILNLMVKLDCWITAKGTKAACESKLLALRADEIESFLFPFGIAFLWELHQSGKEIPCLGEVAKLPSRSVSSWKQRAYDESIESLRANFLFTRPENAQTLVVCSSMPREGKSTL
ncbi:MAG: hypothetical protein ACK553_15865, partial [Planctomycetota bacterium]